ncbi:protein ABHD18-like isoform X1 [Ruditapes philippinarum]|uniref:protein ABHD18-like isoform X1 n=1 Tax=Ruditapes philippinarum TaxID=129788 RepID=UPI00295B6338|nr:protein ABHD18-like isoform X1 [Ruditapes philippinarum]
MSKLDWFWRRLIVTSLYTKGWGKPEDMKRIFNLRKKLGNRDVCRHLVPQDYPVYIDKEVINGDVRLLDGHFMSPLKEILPGIVPKETEIARFQMVLPKEWKSHLRPMCVQMGGTGDHGFGRRRELMAKPLLQEEGIASLILENPFYGTRRPKAQFRSSLHEVNDLFIMGGCIILESLVLFNWLDRLGYGPLGASGISMGGHMASLGVTNWHKPISLIPCMSGSTAAGVFTHGVLSKAIPWDLLIKQYGADEAYERELKKLIVSPEPYWNTPDSMYSEGRKYFHELEDSYVKNAKDNGGKLDIFNIDNYRLPELRDLDKQNKSGTQSTTLSDSIATQSTLSLNNSAENQSTHLSEITNTDQPECEKPLENQSADTENSSNQSSSNILRWLEGIRNKLPGLPGLPSWFKSSAADKIVEQQLAQDCRHFMKGVMDECTHLDNFSVPLDTELIIIVTAENDEYIPVEGYLKLSEIWPGSQVRTLQHGHISGFIMGRKDFRKAIADSFEMQIQKYYKDEIRRAS